VHRRWGKISILLAWSERSRCLAVLGRLTLRKRPFPTRRSPSPIQPTVVVYVCPPSEKYLSALSRPDRTPQVYAMPVPHLSGRMLLTVGDFRILGIIPAHRAYFNAEFNFSYLDKIPYQYRCRKCRALKALWIIVQNPLLVFPC
jgi:hypothetical protein